ncbi:MAG: beta-propeller domain-containing protein [Burkholderiales bacterium]
MSVVLLAGCVSAGETAPRKTLRAFASDREITALFSKWAEEHKRREAAEPLRRFAEGIAGAPVPAPMAAAAPQASAKSASAPAAADSITNVQHAVVDEGGIVKRHGDHLVILRRGRLFTIDVRDRVLKPLSTLDAYGARIDPRGAWYDEMLISGNTIVVIGYSYARGGTEIGLFEISSGGELRYKSTYHLRSNDYYSSRNYASRLIGTRLIFYTPLRLNPWDANPFPRFPAMRRWQSGVDERDFKRIAPATRIYRTDEELDPYQGVALHTVTLCDVAKPELECTSTAVLGPPGRVFYVSGSSVYVWTTTWRHTGAARVAGSAVFRIPLDASAPSALKTAGSPIDQFSFLESEDGHLNVLLRGQGGGEGMWAAEREGGQLALMRVPLSSFSDGKDSAPRLAYRALPAPAPGAMQNRYVGAYLLYGAGAGWRQPQARTESQVYAVTYAGNAPAQTLPLVHGVDRLEALGSNAVAIGSDGKDLHFTTVRLARSAQTVARYTRAGAAQGETRSHGFFYRPQHENNGLAGLPIIGPGRGTAEQLRRTSASLLYLRNDALTLTELGTLDSRADATASDDACAASCADWYGNSRPLFIGNRVLALLGYEIVEGALSDNRITELRRVSFAPHWVEGLK